MPDSDNPLKEQWVSHLSDIVGHCDNETYFVGHSLGVQTILRYLQAQLPSIRVGGCVFVAGFETLSAKSHDPEAQRVLGPWLEEPIHWEAIRGRSRNFVAIFSDNDVWVPLSNVDVFSIKLEAKTIVLHDKGHFSQSSGITELPEALNALKPMIA